MISFQRTLRIPDDGRAYPLPPTLGLFPVRRVSDYHQNLPSSWRVENSVFIPMYQREALWMAFETEHWKPSVVKVGVGRINALTGETWEPGLHDDPQDYLVCPTQPWLDGINAGDGVIRQFVAMPLGLGYTVEGQLSGKEQFGGIQVQVYDPKPGLFPDQPPPPAPSPGYGPMETLALMAPPGMEMGLGAGGQIEQKIYPDEYGLQTWDVQVFGELFVYIVNSAQYQQVTGEPAPFSPVNVQTYTQYRFPWFKLYDENLDQLKASEELAGVKSISEMDTEKGLPPAAEEASVEINASQIKKIE